MNVFGFLSTIVICATIILVIWFIFHKTIRVEFTKIEKKDEPAPIVVPKTPYEVDKQELEKTLKESQVISMDSVIRSANEVMGIEVFGNDDKKEN